MVKEQIKKHIHGTDGWYLVDERAEFTELGLDNLESQYLIDYENGNVISVKGIMYNDVIYYSLNDLKKEMGGRKRCVS